MSKAAAPKKSKKPAAAPVVSEKKKLALEGLPTVEAADDEPKKKKIIRKIKKDKEESEDKSSKVAKDNIPKDNKVKKTKTNSSEKSTKKASSSKDKEDDKEEVIIKKKPAAATTVVAPKKTIPGGFQKKECSEETRNQLADRLKNLNEQILSFKTLGYLSAANGTLYYPVKVVLEPTGIDVELTIQDRNVLVNTGDNRDGNTTLRTLGGKWIFAEKSWSLPLTALPQIRMYFNVIEETKLTKEELDELNEKRQKLREDKIVPGEVKVTDEGDFLLVTSPTAATRNVINELKANCHANWNPSQKTWVVNANYRDELKELLEDAVKEGKITEYEFVSGITGSIEDQ